MSHLKTEPSPQSVPTSSWAEQWLDGVADGSKTMSQRKLSVIEKQGGLMVVKDLAIQRGIHILIVEDDKGSKVVAASLKPFDVIC